MIRITSPNTELKEGDYFIVEAINPKDKFNDVFVKVIGVLRDYDNENSLSGCFSHGWKFYKMSGIVKKIDFPYVIAWYKNEFLLLSENVLDFNKIEFEKDMFNIAVKIYKLDEKEKDDFIGYLSKKEIINKLK